MSIRRLLVLLPLCVVLAGCRGGDTREIAVAGVGVQLPRSWAVQRFGNYCGRVGPGALLTNVRARAIRHSELTPRDCSNGWRLRGLPRTFVLVDLSRFSYPPAPNDPGDYGLPLSLASFDKVAHSPKLATSSFETGGISFSVRVWIGSKASADDRRRVRDLIASIRAR